MIRTKAVRLRLATFSFKIRILAVVCGFQDDSGEMVHNAET